MPRRENRNEGATMRPPLAGRTKPHSASVGRNSPYHGNPMFASSSSSSLNAPMRALDWNDSNALGVGVIANAGAPSGTADAPFLATAETHLGRMTLTAPDNMRRRKAEEKEKKRTARRTKVERLESNAALAAAALLGEEERRSISPSHVMLASASAASDRRPVIPASRSSSNLQTLRAVEVQRSRSPTRPPRPRSAQNAARSDTSPERRPVVSASSQVAQARRARRQRPAPQQAPQRPTSGSERQGARSRQLSRSSSTADHSANEEQSAVRAEALRRATRRRRDIYADLSTMNLPGMSDSDTEDTPPPPFPPNATRPLSPPAMPIEGQEWTEEMRRRQEEYISNLPPNSPPPAFLSEEEGVTGVVSQHVQDHAEEISSDESAEDEMDEDRRLWEDDANAGYTFEERLERERLRRIEKEGEAQIPVQGPSEIVQERNVSIVDQDGIAEPSAQSTEILPNVNLGQIVLEARARRGAAEMTTEPLRVPIESAQLRKSSATSSPKNPIVHRRSVSNEQTRAGVHRTNTNRNINAAIGTGKGLVDGDQHRTTAEAHGKATNVRPRPASESHSRFRDAASAAAARRQALWESIRGRDENHSVPYHATAPGPSAVAGSPDIGTSPNQAPALERRDTASSRAETDDGYHRDSSDSEAEWQKEENQLLEMQRGVSGHSQAIDSSDDETEMMALPGSMPTKRSTAREMLDLPELGRVGRSVPRAPPPLVLGRSRGGAAYSSSSESSNSSEDRRARDQAEETDSDSPVEHEESAPSDVDRFSSSHGRVSLDKGKQVERSSSVSITTGEQACSISDRAGTFVEHSGSSPDFSVDEEEDVDHVPRRSSDADRQRVQNRLRGLFNTQLSAERGDERASNNQTSALPQLPPKDHAFQQEPRNRDNGDVAPPRRSEEFQARSKHTSQPIMTAEEARADALNSISQVQRSRSRLPDGVDRDSLAALERMLSRSGAYARPSVSSVDAEQPLASEPSKLTRSGAITNRQMSSSTFVNPRTVNAPRPLGRLPTITAATRHFPPSQTPAPGQDDVDGQNRKPRIPTRGIATPSWMAYVPAEERRALQEPLRPEVRHAQSSAVGGRVGAMVQRFENQVQTGPSASQPMDQSVQATSSARHIDTLRRRPPPPPPPSSWRRAEEVLNANHGPGSDDILPGTRNTSRSSLDATTLSTSRSQEIEEPTISPAVSIFGNLYTAEEISRSSNSLFRPSRPLPIPPHYDPNALTLSSTPAVQESTSTQLQNTLQEIQQPTSPVQRSESPLEIVRQAVLATPSQESEPALPESPRPALPRRDPSLGITDLDIFASRLADVRNAQSGGDAADDADGVQEGEQRDQYDDLHLLAEFLGPAKQPGLTQDEMEALPVGRVEVLRRRIVGKRQDGRDKIKLVLAVAGVKVERCAVCLVQFKENNMACVFPCLHVLHEQCASKLLRSTTLCPTCRSSVVERSEAT